MLLLIWDTSIWGWASLMYKPEYEKAINEAVCVMARLKEGVNVVVVGYINENS